jgi:hypothetical protein
VAVSEAQDAGGAAGRGRRRRQEGARGAGSAGEAAARETSGAGDKGGAGSAGEPAAQEEAGAKAEEAKKKGQDTLGRSRKRTTYQGGGTEGTAQAACAVDPRSPFQESVRGARRAGGAGVARPTGGAEAVAQEVVFHAAEAEEERRQKKISQEALGGGWAMRQRTGERRRKRRRGQRDTTDRLWIPEEAKAVGEAQAQEKRT